MRSVLRGIGLLALALGMATTASTLDLNADPAENDYLFGRGISIPEREMVKTFRPAENRAGFTFFDGVSDVRVDGGRLLFTLDQPEATLGWGRCLGEFSLTEVPEMWQEQNGVVLGVRVSEGEISWRARPWRDGERQDLSNYPAFVATAQGADWRDVRFTGTRGERTYDFLPADGPTPDGLEFTVQGEPGTRVEIQYLRLVQPRTEGYVRKEFTLPEGEVWRAVADVISSNHRNWYGRSEIYSRLSINGEVVERRGAKHLYHLDPVDIGPYLRPGQNCVGFYGFRIGYAPPIFFQARIIMDSGEVVTWTTDETWRYSPQHAEDWSQPEFDDTAWQPVEVGGSVWLKSRDPAHRLNLPAYKGRLLLSNPDRQDLFYTTDRDVVVDVRAPAGLASRQPTLRYAFGRSDAQGHCTQTAEDTVAEGAVQGEDLVFRIDLGRRDRGVYALALALENQAGVPIEERPREPLVVLRRSTLQPVAGASYTEGLDLALEDEIDFTDPDDPHPWREAAMPAVRFGVKAPAIAEPVIVRKNGLVYREVADPKSGSGFSYRIEFEHPGDWYYFELDYPDDDKRMVEVLVSNRMEGVWTNSEAGLGAETGGRFLNTNTMQTLRWVHVADPGVHSLDIVNVDDGQKAAAAGVRIYHVRGNLPSANAGASRRYGIHTERSFYTNGLGMNFGVQTAHTQRGKLQELDETRSIMTACLADLVWLEASAEKYVQYLKFAGQNCHVMGCYQYTEQNSPYVAAPALDTSRVPWCLRTMMANLFEVNGIDFYAGVEFSQHQDVRSYVNNALLAQGRDSVYMVNAEGEQRYGTVSTMVANWMHPEVRARFFGLMNNLNSTFGHLSRFQGVHGMMHPTQYGAYWIPALGQGDQYDQPMRASFDDITMERFEQDTGIDLPIERTDPQRFQKRAAFLASPGLRDRFFAWRCDKLAEFYAQALDRLRGARTELRYVNAVPIEDTAFYKYYLDSGRAYTDILDDFAMGFGKLGAVDGHSLGRWTISWRHVNNPPLPSQNPYNWVVRTDPGIISAYRGQEPRYVLARTSWHEGYRASAGYAMDNRDDHDILVESDWIMNGYKTRALPQPGGYHAREALLQGLVTADANLLLSGFTDININVGHEQVLRELAKIYTELPRERFAPALETGLDTNLAIRVHRGADESTLYVANPGQWHVTGTVTAQSEGPVRDLLTAEQIAQAGRAELPVDLAPFGIQAFRADANDLEVLAYATDPVSEGELARVRAIPERVRALVEDPQVRLVLSPQDRAYMTEALDQIDRALDENEIARAWSLITAPRFWFTWKQFLEKAVTGLARLPEELGAARAEAGPDPLPTLRARRVEGEVTVDGRLTEDAWAALRFDASFWNIPKKKPPMAQTAVKALYDGQALILAVACADQEPGAVKASAEDESALWQSGDDVIAVFVQPDAGKPIYYQMAINPAGVRFDQRVTGGERDYDFAPQWQAAAQLLQDRGYWTAEIRLPYAAFGASGPGPSWRINVFRRHRNDRLDACAWSWVPGDWHNPDRFGVLAFEGLD